jgi:hypothetical protein
MECRVPPHWALTVREFLDDTYKNHWCSRDGPIPWLANSLDLKPPDFFVWGYVKPLLYKDHRMKMTSNRRSPLPLHRSHWKCCTPRGATCRHGMNCAESAVAVMLSDNNVLMCWDTKVVSLLHVYVPLTGNKVDSSATFPFLFVTSQTDHSVECLCIVENKC